MKTLNQNSKTDIKSKFRHKFFFFSGLLILILVFSEAATGGVLRNFAKFTGKHPCQSLFFNKVAGLGNFIKKETLAQGFSCEFCEISKNTFFTEHLWATAFVFSVSKLYFSVYYKAFQSAHEFQFFFFLGGGGIIFLFYLYNIVYRRFHLSGILTKLGHFLLLKRKFSYDPATKPSKVSIYFVKSFYFF